MIKISQDENRIYRRGGGESGEGGGVKWRGGTGSQQNKNANEMFLTDSQLLTN